MSPTPVRSWTSALALLASLAACERGTSSLPPPEHTLPAAIAPAPSRNQPANDSRPAKSIQALAAESQPDGAVAAVAQGADSAATPDAPAAANSRSEPPSAPQAAFRALELPLEAARDALRAMPETRAYADEFRLHPAKNLLSAVTSAGRSVQSLSPWQAATPSFAWSPHPGENLVILSGDRRAGATLVAYRPAPEGPRFAGSFTTKDEHAPILVAYKSDTRDELLYSTCWGCGGEGGALRVDAAAGAPRLRFMPR